MFPTELHLHQQQEVLEISWDDGHVSKFALRFLRGWCPCAVCQGHFQTEHKFIAVPKATLNDVEPVGSYAIKPIWADGHTSGIYAYEYLRKIEIAPPGDGPSNNSFFAQEK
jgi:DUF971 family protein